MLNLMFKSNKDDLYFCDGCDCVCMTTGHSPVEWTTHWTLNTHSPLAPSTHSHKASAAHKDNLTRTEWLIEHIMTHIHGLVHTYMFIHTQMLSSLADSQRVAKKGMLRWESGGICHSDTQKTYTKKILEWNTKWMAYEYKIEYIYN